MAAAQNRDDVGYFTGTLGIGPNDVRDEPQFSSEENGFPGTEFSPENPTLILESFVEYGQYFAHADTNNIRNRVLHGSDYGSWEYHIHPGMNVFQAYWGWWDDEGSGMELQDHGLGGGPNGAIDDADDDRNTPWDEFVWRGPNNAASLHGQCIKGEDDGATYDKDGDGVYSYNACAEDEMLVFVQPGTHDIHANCIPGLDGTDCALGNHSDKAGEPDFIMEWDETSDDEEEEWREENGFSRIHYDQSLLMSTTVTTSVDPAETGDGAYVPEDAEAFDRDAYTVIHPAMESLYRTTVYDPGDQAGGPGDGLVHEEGPKQFAKEDPTAVLDPVIENVTKAYRSVSDPAFDSVNPARGTVNDQVFPGYLHEPNTAADDYGTFATFDADTCYGDCSDGADADSTADFYEPGANQDYVYDDEEHFWGDSFAGRDFSYNAIKFRGYGGANYMSSGVDDAGQNTGERSMLPASGLYLEANVGTWYDANGDTWVGNISDERGVTDTTRANEDDPYSHGLISDPNSYGSDEFRGTCSADLQWTVEPVNNDIDNDGKQEWGTTGVYVYASTFNPYTPIVEDATGGAGADLTKPVRDAHGDAAVIVPGPDEDSVQGGGQLSRYVTEGPVQITGFCSSVQFGSGDWDPNQVIMFPTGNHDYDVKITLTATLTDTERTAISDASNGGNSLTGETITDVDFLEATT